jgi:predicted polyphosphate/ATP-dependent NAD kinase
MTRIGLIVNPTAGMGGSVGLKGTDGVLDEARRRGGRPRAPQRAIRALESLGAAAPTARLVTCAGLMGEDEALAAGVGADVVLPVTAVTTAQDTRRAARTMLEARIELLLFVGGDGTAADIEASVGRGLPAVGVPAGVKMHSGVFAHTPEAAGLLAARFVTGRSRRVASREVMDVDEDLLRDGVLAPRLLGYLEVPDDAVLVQHPKRRGASDREQRLHVGQAVQEALPARALVAVGPGTTAGALMEILGLPHTLLGFDLIRDGALVASDVRESDLLPHADELFVVISPTGGQGSLLGRGNQQLSTAVLCRIEPDRLLIAATRDRIAALGGRPLRVDLDDPEVADSLAGMHRVLVGPGRAIVYPVAQPDWGLSSGRDRRDLDRGEAASAP